jgi:hypothetical protein
MALAGTQSMRGTPGRKLYENKKLPDKFAGLNLKQKLEAIVARIRQTDRESRIRRNTVHYLMALYYQGYQNVDLEPGSAFTVYERSDFYVENQFRRHVDSVVNGLSKNEGELIIRPTSSQPNDLAAAQAAGPILDMQKSTIGYDRVRDVKNLYKCLFGTSFQFTDYIRDQRYGTIVRPKFSYEEIPDEDGGEPFMSKVPNGYEKINRGREITVVCSPLEIDVRADVKSFEDLPYLRWKTRQEVELLNYMYPGLGADGGTDSAAEDMAQQYMDVLANLPGNILGDSIAGNVNNVKKLEYERTWLQPCMFANDKELMREFPEGCHVAMVDGKCVDYYAENLMDRWTYEVLIPVPHSLMGDGLYDALLMQDQINELNSLVIQHTRYSTVGHNIYDSTVIDPKNIINDPKNGWVKGTPTLDKKVAESVFQVRPAPLGPEVIGSLNDKRSSMEDMTSSYGPSVGKGIGANTPYSQSVFLTERAQSRWQGSLAFNRPELTRFHKQLLKIAQNDWLEPKTAAVMANTGAWSFQQFSALDLAGDVDISFSDKDLAPKSRAEQVQALQMYAELAMVIQQMPPKQKLRVEEMLGLPPDSNPMSTQISRAYRQIDRISKGDQITPLPFVDNPEVQIPVLDDFMASQQGEDVAMASPEIFAKIYEYRTALMIQFQQSMNLVKPGQPAPPQQAQPGQGGSPEKPGDKKPAGGQPGQAPGGAPAQSPAKNAPPVSPPAA